MSLVDEFADFVGAVPYREVEMGGRRVQVWDAGEGRPVVLLHGIAAGRRAFFRLVPLLAAGHRVIVPPLRGEDLPAPRATYARLLDDLAELLRALDLRDATLFGFSFGGTIALKYGARRDPRVSQIRVQGTFPRFRLRGLDRAAHWASYLVPSAAGSAYFAWRVRRGPEMGLLAAHAPGLEELFPRWCALTPFPTLRRRIGLIGALDMAEEVRAIEVPVAFAHGAEDRVVPRTYFDELRRLRPEATADLLEGAGHNAALTHPHPLSTWIGAWHQGGSA